MAYSTAEFHRQRMVETRDDIARKLHDLADRIQREQPSDIEGKEETSAYVYIQFAASIEEAIRWGIPNLGLHRLWTSASTLAYTETANALQQED